uniref:Putative Erf family protein n=1 Tax=viral metagenome TaxID=1070528 RepID=A0A6M3LED9_9ZZZZ
MQIEGKSLAGKLVAVMAAIDYIPKRGHNQPQNYDYVRDADIADTVRKEMVAQRVVMLPRTTRNSVREITSAKGNIITINTVEMDFTFIDADSGESFIISTVGEGMDSGDKGVYKAMTGATKYALLKAFQIPTGDDPEADDGPAQPLPPLQASPLAADTAAPRTAAPAATPSAGAAAPRTTTPAVSAGAAASFKIPYGDAKGKTFAEASDKELRWFDGQLSEIKLADPQYGEGRRKAKTVLLAELKRREDAEAADAMGTEVDDGIPFDGGGR